MSACDYMYEFVQCIHEIDIIYMVSVLCSLPFYRSKIKRGMLQGLSSYLSYKPWMEYRGGEAVEYHFRSY